MSKVSVGTVIDELNIESIQGQAVQIPSNSNLTHLQFRRFAGCPMCNPHIQAFIRNHQTLVDHGIQEVAVFHSTKSDMLLHHSDAPFPLIADPDKSLYKKFGVEASVAALLHPKAWMAGMKGLFVRGAGLPALGESITGLPADFLIDASGKVLAVKYGTHAYDHWELEEVIELALHNAHSPMKY